jgi:hypothetical protein
MPPSSEYVQDHTSGNYLRPTQSLRCGWAASRACSLNVVQVRDRDRFCVDSMDEYAASIYNHYHEQLTLGFPVPGGADAIQVQLSRCQAAPFSLRGAARPHI